MRKFLITILTLIIVFTSSAQAFARNSYDLDAVINDTAMYIYENVPRAQVASIGGEWAVLGLARSGVNIPADYYQSYYENVEDYVKKCNGVLHTKKYTEYARVIIALTSIGKNPADVAGYNLLAPLGDYEKTIQQGINGPIWALTALDCGNYEMPENPEAKVQATREMYIEKILKSQLPDGGWSLMGGEDNSNHEECISDPDITGMALQALSKYQNDKRVKEATERAINAMSGMQDEKGGFSNNGIPNSESCVQMLVALCELGIDFNDGVFIKNGYTILDNLMNYYSFENGFSHDKSSNSSNLMASEQALYGLVAVKRFLDEETSLYTMSDAISFTNIIAIGLPNKNADVKKTSIEFPGKTFADIAGHASQGAIEELTKRGIINGKTQTDFEPESTMTRAEFAAIIARGLGLTQKDVNVFEDVKPDDWFCSYVSTAYAYGIVNGTTQTKFNPNGNITREEAGVMIARSAKLCGMATELNSVATRNILAQFFDYILCSDWSREGLAFCYSENILDDSVMEINPREAVTRAEVAEMLYNMLKKAKLL